MTTAVAQQPQTGSRTGTTSSQNKSKGIAIQAKLTVGQPNDQYEQEADRIADRVMRMPDRTAVQRKCTACEEEDKIQQKPLVAGITPWVQRQSDEENHNRLQNKLYSRFTYNPLPASAREPETLCDTSISCVQGDTYINLNYDRQEGNYDENTWNRKIYYREKEAGDFKPVSRGNMEAGGGIITVTGLNPSTTYEFKVECSSSGRSASTKEGITECKTLPVPPKKENKTRKQSPATRITPKIQRQATAEPQVSASLESRLNNSKSGGSPLPDNTRSFMESRIGTDFSNVKIHTDSNAIQMSQELGAQAFTHGNHIYFNSGKYSPESASGKHLLAHEMVHTIHQSGQILHCKTGPKDPKDPKVPDIDSLKTTDKKHIQLSLKIEVPTLYKLGAFIDDMIKYYDDVNRCVRDGNIKKIKNLKNQLIDWKKKLGRKKQLLILYKALKPNTRKRILDIYILPIEKINKENNCNVSGPFKYVKN